MLDDNRYGYVKHDTPWFFQESGLRIKVWDTRRFDEFDPDAGWRWYESTYDVALAVSHAARRKNDTGYTFDVYWVHSWLIRSRVPPGKLYRSLVRYFDRRCNCAHDCCGHVFHHCFRLRRVKPGEYRFSYWASKNL